MTTRQYIGARYIPVFADPVEWTDERTYEPLTMVQHLGETYMTKQAVPLGIQLPDTSQGQESNEYWVHMSNWNAQVETYRQEVLQYNGRISTLEDDLPIASFDSVDTVKKAIDGLQDQIGTGFDYTDNITAVIGSGFDATDTIASAVSALQAQDAIRAIDFETVSDMQSSDDLANGMFVHTLGFHSAGDGGAAYYLISDTGTANGMDVLTCGDLYANLVYTDIVTPEMFGAHGDGTTDDSAIFDYILKLKDYKIKLQLLSKKYYIATPIAINANKTLVVDIEGTSNQQYVLGGDSSPNYEKYSVIVLNTDFIKGASTTTSILSGSISNIIFIPKTTGAISTCTVFNTLKTQGLNFYGCGSRWINTVFDNCDVCVVSRIYNNKFLNLITLLDGGLVDSEIYNNYISGNASSDTIAFNFKLSGCADSRIRDNFFDYFKYMYVDTVGVQEITSSNNIYEIFGCIIKYNENINLSFNSLNDSFLGNSDEFLTTNNNASLIATEKCLFPVNAASVLSVINPLFSIRVTNIGGVDYQNTYPIIKSFSKGSTPFYPGYLYSYINVKNISLIGGRSLKLNALFNIQNSYSLTSTNQRVWINVDTIFNLDTMPDITGNVWNGMKVHYIGTTDATFTQGKLYMYMHGWKEVV